MFKKIKTQLLKTNLAGMSNIRIQLTFLLSVVILSAFAQNGSKIIEDNLAYRMELNAEYSDGATSPLEKKDLLKFDSLDFFPIDTSFAVLARFERIDQPISFQMETTTTRKPIYNTYARLYFTIDTIEYSLEVFQNHGLITKEGYENYLFLPFKDLTNGSSTYRGGRYLNFDIPEGDTILIDFNKAYNPYCLYNKRYSCPIVPPQNFINYLIEAGVKDFKKD